ncbi:hypothetical protein BSP10_201 [Bacillus phage BSP10]|nr:hypothetical protein BSP10_201 [Bacillus phage BSP10]
MNTQAEKGEEATMEMDRDAACVLNENLLSIRIGEDSNLR